VLDRRLAEALEEARADGLAQGYAAGWAQGRRAAAEEELVERARREEQALAERRATAERAHALLAALAQASSTATASAEPAWAELADALVEGALGIARAVLARELAAVDAPVAESVRAAVRALGEPGEVTVRMHPDDLAMLDTLPAAALPPGVTVVADGGQAPGTVRATTPTQRLLLDLPGALAGAREVLAR
jgi:flagellar assembly protein FliH